MNERRARSCRRWGGWVLLAAGLCLGFGGACAVETRHRVLTFFFEGVPPPGQPYLVEPVAKEQQARLEKPVSFHTAFRKDRCTECHLGRRRHLKTPLPDLCWQCHPRPTPADPWNHAPARVGDCMACHAGHETMTAQLLLGEGKALCYLCHRTTYMETLPAHQGVNLDRCGDCHRAHEGGTRPNVKETSGIQISTAEDGV